MKRSRMALMIFLCSFGSALHVVGFIDADRSEAADLKVATAAAPAPVTPAYTENGLCTEPGLQQLRLVAADATVHVASVPQTCPIISARSAQPARETTPTFLNPGFGICVHDDLLAVYESWFCSAQTVAVQTVPTTTQADLAVLAEDARHSVGQEDALLINATNDGLTQVLKTGAARQTPSDELCETEWDGYDYSCEDGVCDEAYDDSCEQEVYCTEENGYSDDSYDYSCEAEYDYCYDEYEYCYEEREEGDDCGEAVVVEAADVFAVSAPVEYLQTVPGDEHWQPVAEQASLAAEPLYAEEVVREDLTVEVEETQAAVDPTTDAVAPTAQTSGVRSWLVATSWVVRELGNWLHGASAGLERLALEVPEVEPAAELTPPAGSPLGVGFRPMPESYLGL